MILGRDCPDGPKDTKSCYRCGLTGHISRDCPQSGAPAGGPQGGGGGGGGSQECYKASSHNTACLAIIVKLTFPVIVW